MEGLVIAPLNNRQFNQNEITILRLGENPEEFDHYIFGKLASV